MNNPNTQQKRVLRAITRQALDVRKLLARSESVNSHGPTGGRNPAYHPLVHKQRELEAAAVAGGVPREWIDQTRYRGELGMAWRPDLHWREHAPIDRPQLLTALEHEVRQVREIAAVAAAYGQRGALAEAGTAQLFARNLDTLARRTAAVAHLLNLSADETEQLWGRQDIWAKAAAWVGGESETSLEDRWRAVARLDTRTDAGQVAALADAGIGAGLPGNPAPSTARMVQRIQQQMRDHTSTPAPGRRADPPTADPDSVIATDAVIGTGSSPHGRHLGFGAAQGEQITESVAAAGLARDFRPVFRSPADPEPSPPTAVIGGLEP